jgi:lipoprotein-anchoring transpeptidase ErfK/SrfK
MLLFLLVMTLIYGASAFIPSSTTFDSRIAASPAVSAPVQVTLPDRIVPAIPPLSEGAEAFAPGALTFLPDRLRVSAENAVVVTDTELEPIRQQLERDRVAAIQRLAANQQATATRASMIATTPGSSPVRLSSAIGPQERWIDVNLSSQAVTAMIGGQPVHYALATTGAKGMETPTGEFRINYRVYNETMTSASLGIPAEVENYRLENVLFTQYFTNEGHALHLNYWRPDSYFGNIPSSHGCAGLRYADAEYLWNFAGVGTRLVIHY